MNAEPWLPLTQLLTGDDTRVVRLVEGVSDVFTAHGVRSLKTPGGWLTGPSRVIPGGVEIQGRFRVPPDQAYDVVAERFQSLGYLALFRRAGTVDLIQAMPGRYPTAPRRYTLSIILFVLTLVSVLWQGANYADSPGLLAGWPFAASLLGILLAHELGHFIVARRLGVPASPPFFIPFPVPFPFGLFGTLGAVILMTAPPRDRRALLAVAAAGPLAGLVVAIPVLLLGLSLSEVRPIPQGTITLQEGNSLLYLGLKYLMFGQVLPSGGFDVFLHQVALAGWVGLLVTGLNLIPAGSLDGGNIAYALLGDRARWLTWAVVVALLALSLVWPSWLLWVVLAALLGRWRAAPLDDVTPLRGRDLVAGLAAVVAFVLVFTPVPIVFVGLGR